MSMLEALRHSWAVPEGQLQVETDDRRLRLTGLLVVLLGFGATFGWAATAPLSSAAVAPGIVTVESSRKAVQHLEGGIVRSVLVRDGDRVKAGDLLVRLDETQARAQLEMARLQYYAQVAQQERLIAEQTDATSLEFSPELRAHADDPRVADMLKGQAIQFETRRKARLGEISVLEQRVDQLLAQQRGQQELADAKMRTIASYKNQLQELQKLYQQKMIDNTRMREYERASSELEGERAEAISNAAAVKVQAGETRLQILQLARDFQKEVASDLRDTQSRVFDLEQRINALRDVLQHTEIRAPADGQVMNLGVHNEGAVLSPGARVLDIIPLNEALVIEAQVQPGDIDRVHVDQAADVRMSAFHDRSTPVLSGKVLVVSADRVTDPNTRASYYTARVEVSTDELAKLGNKQLKPGMPAEVLIKTGERTALDYFIRPLTDVFARSFTER